MVRIFRWFIVVMYPNVWVRPELGTEDDGFESWKLNAWGDLLDKRFMSEARRFREYGDFFGIK